jgi:hypothetical protein
MGVLALETLIMSAERVYSYPCPKLIPFDAIVSGTELFSAAEEGNSWKPYEKLPAPPCNIFSSLSPVDTSAVLHCREEGKGGEWSKRVAGR